MISIIIPVYNEADEIENAIKRTREACKDEQVEMIIVDGGSSDDTVTLAMKEKAVVVKSAKGRARQMNLGASVAKGDILYFLHADSTPPLHFDASIKRAIQSGASSGCFRLAFDYDHWFLKANCWFTRFDVNAVRFGDQSLFVLKEVFEKCEKFSENLIIMEDQEIIHRIKRHGKFVVIQDDVTTSARKYLDNGIYRMQVIFFRIWALYYLGYTQGQMLTLYKKLISKHKL